MGLVSDARMLNRFADATVFLVRQRYTPLKQLEMINELYHQKAFAGLALLVNDVMLSGSNAYYGYSYSYGYGYGYGQGFNYNMSYSNYSDKVQMKWYKRLFHVVFNKGEE